VWRRAVARVVRSVASEGGRAKALEDLARRADESDAGLRRADEQFVNLAVHSTERTNALTDRVADAESRLAELEIDAARLREAVRRLAEGPGPEAADEVASWRERLASPATASVPVARHGPVARVVTDVGPLLLPAHDEVMLSYMRQHGRWEQEESDRLRALLRPGMTFVDVGAHVGYMTLLAAAAVGPTGLGFAFEPEPINHRLLLANLANAGIANVHAVPAAAWDRSGRLRLSLCADNTGDHRAYELSGRESVEVLALALDDVLPEGVAVDVVKVDAQGTDDVAIRGMERMLARSRPVLVVEFWPAGIEARGAVPREVLAHYRDLDYDLAVLGGRPGAGFDAVLEAAQSSPTEFCTLVLTPSE